MFLVVILDHDARSQQTRNRRKTLMKYCVCAWGVPAIAVLACVTLDYTDTVKIGYGKYINRNFNIILENGWFLARHICTNIGARAAKVSNNKVFTFILFSSHITIPCFVYLMPYTFNEIILM